jgi:flagellar hook-associated protein 1 FlgK
MSGLTTSLSIGIQAIEAAQGALNATSNNIANANTPGYTREVPQLSEVQQTQVGSTVSGGGVSLTSLKSIRDELLNLQIQQQTSQQSSADTQSALLQQVQSYFSSSSGVDIASALSAFSASLASLSANSTNGGARQGVLSAGQNLANAFNSTANGLYSAASQADAQVTQSVAQINSLAAQIAQLNPQLNNLLQAGGDGGTLQDQRDELLQQLSQLTAISITQSTDGETITTGNGTPLVVGSRSFQLQTTTGANGTQRVLDPNGNDITNSLTSGQLGGAINLRDNTIAGFSSQLNTLATEVANAFNTAQTQGFDSNGNAGQPIFSVPVNPSYSAAQITVSISDPALIAASSDGSYGSNGNVSNLSAALTSSLPSGQTPSAAYAALVFGVGDAASSISAESTAVGLNLQQLTNLQGSISGVNTDEEATNLIRFQTAFEAAARIVSTIQHLNTVVLNMGTSGGY